MSTLAALAAQHAGEAAAKAAIRAATLLQTALAANKAKIQAAAHAAVDAAAATTTDHSTRAAVRAAHATVALADALPADDHSADAEEVRAQSTAAAQAVVTAIITASQTLFTALQALQRDLHAAQSPLATDPAGSHVDALIASTEHALSLVQLAAQAFGGHVSGPPTAAESAVHDALAAVQGVIDHGRALVAEILRSTVTGADHIAQGIKDDLDRAEAMLSDIAGAAGAGVAAGGVATIAIVIGVLLAFAHKS